MKNKIKNGLEWLVTFHYWQCEAGWVGQFGFFGWKKSFAVGLEIDKSGSFYRLTIPN